MGGCADDCGKPARVVDTLHDLGKGDVVFRGSHILGGQLHRECAVEIHHVAFVGPGREDRVQAPMPGSSRVELLFAARGLQTSHGKAGRENHAPDSLRFKNCPPGVDGLERGGPKVPRRDSMQKRTRWTDFLGGLALAGALLLASPPGVQMASADSTTLRSGPVCSSAALSQTQDPSLERFLAEIRQQAVAQSSSGRADSNGWVVLNNRGFNYTSTQEPSPERSRTSPPASRVR